MRLAIISVFFGCVFVGACYGNDQTVSHVVIDDWWNVDYAKSWCLQLAGTDTPCVGDPTIDVRSFETQIVTAFATDLRCKGLNVTTFEGPGKPSNVYVGDKRSWSLMLDYSPIRVSQKWTLVGKSPAYLEGTGEPKEIANRICVALNQRGATVEDENP